MILAFGHKARHGKDTAGEAVADHFNSNRQHALNNDYFLERVFPEARIFKFADELYRVCREEYGMTKKDAPLLQKIGDGRRREFGQDYWIKQLDPKIKAFKGIAIITDVRYTNEADYINSIGGHCINVRRLSLDGSPFVTDDRDPNFISEIQLDGYDYEFFITAKTGQSALVAEQAITIAEYVRGLEGPKK